MQSLFVEWYMRDRIVLVRATGSAVADTELMVMDEMLCRDYLDRTFSSQLHILIDHTRLTTPPNLRLSLRFPTHRKLGMCLSYGTTDLLPPRVKYNNLYSFTLLEDCLNFLLEKDHSLPRRLPKVV